MVDIHEHMGLVLEAQQAVQRSGRDKVGEEVPRRVVGGDAGRDDEAGTAGRGEVLAVELSKDRVGVDVAEAAEREAAGVTDQVAGGLGIALRGDESS
jgi:hypothetical protein